MSLKTIIITGSAGLVGSECVRFFAGNGYRTVGIDGDLRRQLFDVDAGNASVAASLLDGVLGYIHERLDIRDVDAINSLFYDWGPSVSAVIHCAAQPSHDWAASDPITDFEINARGTLNMLEATRKYCPKAAFVFMSTNKVYGDRPNYLNLIDLEGRSEFFDAPSWYPPAVGISESMPVDSCTHSLFGCSKLAADLYVQEYGRYFGMNTVCFRGGCLTGPAHAGTKLHGFLSYLVKCCVTGTPYEVIGYGGKQVRDNLHAHDLVRAFDCYLGRPSPGAVYNLGGGRENSCSVLEAVALAEEITGQKMTLKFTETPRSGDHKWWITDNSKFMNDYPNWRQKYTLRQTVTEIVEAAKVKAAA